MCSPTVHPRAGGEHRVQTPIQIGVDGSSPRGRGTPVRWRHDLVVDRFIPARAGNTMPGYSWRKFDSVHPRAGGEHIGGRSHPPPMSGSSPRGRGTLGYRPFHPSYFRFIPARAGNTLSRLPQASRVPVHPRAGGEHGSGTTSRAAQYGSSPRGRGTRGPTPDRNPKGRFIPARAGNTRTYTRSKPEGPVHPRAGGEHADAGTRVRTRSGSSPRGRGTHRSDDEVLSLSRFIPARAGNTCRAPSRPE